MPGLPTLPDRCRSWLFPLLACGMLTAVAGCGESAPVDSTTEPAGTTTPAYGINGESSAGASGDPAGTDAETTSVPAGLDVATADTTDDESPSTEDSPPPESTTPEQQAIAALHDAIARLEKKDYAGFVKYYVPFREIQQMRDRGGNRAMVLSLIQSPKMVTRLLKVLKQVEDATPTIDSNLGLATFTVELPESEQPAPVAVVDEAGAIGSSDDVGYQLPLKETLAAAVEDLEGDNVLRFIRMFFPADELQRISTSLEGKPFPQEMLLMRIKARPEMITQMKDDLKRIQELEPQMEDSGNVAVYTIPGEMVTTERTSYKLPDRTFRLAKDGESWKIAPSAPKLQKKLAEMESYESQPLTVTIVFEQIGDAWRILSLDE